MRARIGGLGLLLSVVLLSAACVSKGTYSNVVSERDVIKAQLTTLQTDLSKSQSDLATAETGLAAAAKERDDLKAQLTTAQASLASISKELDGLKAQVNTANAKATQAQKYVDVAQASLRLVATSFGGSPTEELGALGQLGAAANATGDQPLIDSLNSFAKALGTPAEDDAGLAFLKLTVQRLDENKLVTK